MNFLYSDCKETTENYESQNIIIAAEVDYKFYYRPHSNDNAPYIHTDPTHFKSSLMDLDNSIKQYHRVRYTFPHMFGKRDGHFIIPDEILIRVRRAGMEEGSYCCSIGDIYGHNSYFGEEDYHEIGAVTIYHRTDMPNGDICTKGYDILMPQYLPTDIIDKIKAGEIVTIETDAPISIIHLHSHGETEVYDRIMYCPSDYDNEGEHRMYDHITFQLSALKEEKND